MPGVAVLLLPLVLLLRRAREPHPRGAGERPGLGRGPWLRDGLREASPGVGPRRAELRRQVAAGGARGVARGPRPRLCQHPSAPLRLPESQLSSRNLFLESEGGPRPAGVDAARVSFYCHREGVLNGASALRTSPLARADDAHAAGLVSPAFSHPILHSFWVTLMTQLSPPPHPCKATWENLSLCAQS